MFGFFSDNKKNQPSKAERYTNSAIGGAMIGKGVSDVTIGTAKVFKKDLSGTKDIIDGGRNIYEGSGYIKEAFKEEPAKKKGWFF